MKLGKLNDMHRSCVHFYRTLLVSGVVNLGIQLLARYAFCYFADNIAIKSDNLWERENTFGYSLHELLSISFENLTKTNTFMKLEEIVPKNLLEYSLKVDKCKEFRLYNKQELHNLEPESFMALLAAELSK